MKIALENILEFIERDHMVKLTKGWLKDKFQTFAAKEVEISSREKASLVGPSRDNTLPLGIRLRYPTFTVWVFRKSSLACITNTL